MTEVERALDEPPEVHEVAGPAFTPVEAGATITVAPRSLVVLQGLG